MKMLRFTIISRLKIEQELKMKYLKVGLLAVLISVLTAVMLITAGCATEYSPTTTNPVPQAGIRDFNIQMVNLSPTVSGTDVKVQLLTQDQNYKVDTFAQKILYYFDVTPPTTAGQPAKTAAGTFQEPDLGGSLQYAVIFKNVPVGKHTFSAQLVNSDYTPLNPPLTIRTEVPIPSETTQTPALETVGVETDYGFALSTASVYGFRLNDDAIGKANKSGEGHFIFYLDVDPPTAPGQPAFSSSGTYQVQTYSVAWKKLSAGQHTFSLQLVNNDNTPLNPPVIAKTTVDLLPVSQ
jgi:hypothetical protein